MTLDQFIEKAASRLEAFNEHWKEQHKIKPLDWPLEGLNEAEWFEQLEMFMEDHK